MVFVKLNKKIIFPCALAWALKATAFAFCFLKAKTAFYSSQKL